MIDKIIPPRRDEILSKEGIGTTRLMEYLERVAGLVNDTIDISDTELQAGVSFAMLAALSKQISDIESELSTAALLNAALANLQKRVADLQIQADAANNSAALASLEKSTVDRRYALLVG